MNSGSKRAFVLAAVVHVFAFGFVFFGYFFKPEEKKETVVFQVFDPPSGASSERQPAEEARPQPPPRLNIPEVELTPVELPQATPRERRPAPEPEPAPAPRPPPAPTPAPRPTPPAPQPRTTAEEFFADRPRQAPAPTPAPRAPVTAPRINTSQITRDLASTLTSASESRQVSQLSASDQQALQAYFGRLHSAIERSWRKPGGISTRLEATVQFSVSRDGRVFGARIVSSSGNDIFDRSILEAFARVGSVGATPDGEGYTPQLTFRME